MTGRPRTVFGTPAFAVPVLAALHESTEVVTVVCQPDRPAGRGQSVVAPPVKLWALERGLEVRQPTRLKDGVVAAWLRDLAPDVALVVAYGRILPPDVLSAPRMGCVNLHASVLPRHRGAAPIQWALLSGDRETGVSLMAMDAGMDTGPVLAIRRTPIGADENAIDLAQRLSRIAVQSVHEDLPGYLEGRLLPVPQDPVGVTLAPPLTKEMARIDWRRSALAVHDQVRGLQPWPGASTLLGTRRLIVCATRLDEAPRVLGGAPGEVVAVPRDRIWVATGNGLVALVEVQLEGKRRMGAREFLAGHPLRTGTVLGQEIAG